MHVKGGRLSETQKDTILKRWNMLEVKGKDAGFELDDFTFDNFVFGGGVKDFVFGGGVTCWVFESGRLSATNPNLQQVPGRFEELAKPIRQLFLPYEGELWASNDYSQAEPRITVHYAFAMGLAGAAAARQKYIDDPKTDYTRWWRTCAADWTARGWLSR
jgi:DNA polymerase family A